MENTARRTKSYTSNPVTPRLRTRILRKKWNTHKQYRSNKYKRFKARMHGNLVCIYPEESFGMEVFKQLQADSLKHGFKWMRLDVNDGKLTIRSLKFPGISTVTTNPEAIRRYTRWFYWMKNLSLNYGKKYD